MPAEKMAKIVTFDKDKAVLTIDSGDLSLDQQKVSLTILVESEEIPTSEPFRLEIAFELAKPEFDLEAFEVPPITCSEKDKDWQLILPPVQQESIFDALSIDLVSESNDFVYDGESIVALSLSYASKLERGKICPKDEKIELEFNLKSGNLGFSS